MSALKPVGVNTTFATSTTSARSVAISQQSDTIRVVAESAGAYVAIGTLPTATHDNFYVTSTDPEKISIGPVLANRVVGITTGTTTTIDFPEGTGSPFGWRCHRFSDLCGQSTFDFSHKIVSSVNNSSGVGGFFSTRIVVDHDSSSIHRRL